MNLLTACALFAVVFGLGVVAGFEFAAGWYLPVLEQRQRELKRLRKQIVDKKHSA